MARGKQGSTSLSEAAKHIGEALGQVAARVDSWKQQRDEIVSEIRQVVKTGHRLLAELGHASETPGAAVKTSKVGRKRGYKMSEETKAKLRAAWKRRKARAAAEAKQ